ncbi:MAG: hemolysin III family protein [Candidatus Delongbacteria bacterium]
MAQPVRPLILREEIASSVIHGVGLVFALAGLGVLTAFASTRGTPWHVTACSIYGATLILLFGASTLYHAVTQPRVRAVLRVIDHSAIYLLIAGTYTPFTLVNLRGPWGWSLFGVVWGLALLGIIFQTRLLRTHLWAGLSIYLLMGWAIVVAVLPLLRHVAPGGLALLAAGGLAYTLGSVFYAWKSLPWGHPIWHVFVLAGGVLHYFAILFYVIPLAG